MWSGQYWKGEKGLGSPHLDENCPRGPHSPTLATCLEAEAAGTYVPHAHNTPPKRKSLDTLRQGPGVYSPCGTTMGLRVHTHKNPEPVNTLSSPAEIQAAYENG